MKYKTYINKNHAFYLRIKAMAIPKKWAVLRQLGKYKLSTEAQLKHERIIFYNTIGNKKAVHTAQHFGINKWLEKKRDEFDLKLYYNSGLLFCEDIVDFF